MSLHNKDVPQQKLHFLILNQQDAPSIKSQLTAINQGKHIGLLSSSQLHQTTSSQNTTPPNHHSHNHLNQATTPQPSQPSQAFLSLLPRSLSSLSLGGRRNKTDKDLTAAPLNNTTDFLHTTSAIDSTTATALGNMATSPTPPYNMSQSLHNPLQTQQHRNSAQQLFHIHQQQLQQLQQQQHAKGTPKSSKSKNKFAAQTKSFIEEDIPPPLPQRNHPRQLQLDASNTSNASNTFSPISDLDNTASGGTSSPIRNSPQPPAPLVTNSPQNPNNKSKRSKAKTKALSDPKMSTQMFLQMESSVSQNVALHGAPLEETPPPLPPRLPGMLDDAQAGHRGSIQNLNTSIRPPPNSVDTLMQYPLVSTCTPVHRDNMSAAFPLSQRPNIVQQLQQHQQQLHSVISGGSNTGVSILYAPLELLNSEKYGVLGKCLYSPGKIF